MTTETNELTEGDSSPSRPAKNPEVQAKIRRGLFVAGWLTVLTVIEYFIAVGFEKPLLPLIPFAAAKGWLIMEYFMHFSAVLSGGDH